MDQKEEEINEELKDKVDKDSQIKDIRSALKSVTESVASLVTEATTRVLSRRWMLRRVMVL